MSAPQFVISGYVPSPVISISKDSIGLRYDTNAPSEFPEAQHDHEDAQTG
jgi:hypothetical protein